MEQLNINRNAFNKLVVLQNWIAASPAFFKGGDSFWDRVATAQTELTNDVDIDDDQFELTMVETKGDTLVVTYYDNETGDDVEYELVPVDVCPF